MYKLKNVRIMITTLLIAFLFSCSVVCFFKCSTEPIEIDDKKKEDHLPDDLFPDLPSGIGGDGDEL